MVSLRNGVCIGAGGAACGACDACAEASTPGTEGGTVLSGKVSTNLVDMFYSYITVKHVDKLYNLTFVLGALFVFQEHALTLSVHMHPPPAALHVRLVLTRAPKGVGIMVMGTTATRRCASDRSPCVNSRTPPYGCGTARLTSFTLSSMQRSSRLSVPVPTA